MLVSRSQGSARRTRAERRTPGAHTSSVTLPTQDDPRGRPLRDHLRSLEGHRCEAARRQTPRRSPQDGTRTLDRARSPSRARGHRPAPSTRAPPQAQRTPHQRSRHLLGHAMNRQPKRNDGASSQRGRHPQRSANQRGQTTDRRSSDDSGQRPGPTSLARAPTALERIPGSCVRYQMTASSASATTRPDSETAADQAHSAADPSGRRASRPRSQRSGVSPARLMTEHESS